MKLLLGVATRGVIEHDLRVAVGCCVRQMSLHSHGASEPNMVDCLEQLLGEGASHLLLPKASAARVRGTSATAMPLVR